MYPLTVDPLTEFFDSIRSPITKEKYTARLDIFLKHIKIEGSTLSERAKNFTEKARNLEWTTFVINNYMHYQKERAEKGEISESTLMNFYKPIRLFLDMNDVTGINWKKITRRIPKGRKYGKDRAPTLSEVKKILDYPDRRIKPIILLMLSSGIRLGAWDYLNWSHIIPIKKDEQIVSAKIIVYAGTNDEYYSFITPEAYNSINEYIKYRESNNEKINSDSPVMRDLFHPDRGGKGEPHLPKQLKSSGVKRLIEKAVWGTGLRVKLEDKQRRHPFQAVHGFRKFFKTTCEKSMRSLCVEIQMGHSVGVTDSYYKPTEDEMLSEYLKAVEDLTILDTEHKPAHEDIEELKKENKKLKNKFSTMMNMIIKLQEGMEKYNPEIEKLQEKIVLKEKESFLVEKKIIALKNKQKMEEEKIEEFEKAENELREMYDEKIESVLDVLQKKEIEKWSKRNLKVKKLLNFLNSLEESNKKITE